MVGCAWYDNCNGYSEGGWYDYGRWVLLAIIIFLALAVTWGVRVFSMNRVRHGRSPPTGTGWMVPPSYYQSQQQYGNPINSAPPYNPAMGDQDAGYYDQSGNFVAKPPVAYHSENPYDNNEQETGTAPEHVSGPGQYYPPEAHSERPVNGVDGSQVGPPPGPPPGHAPVDNNETGTSSGGSNGANAVNNIASQAGPPSGPPPSSGSEARDAYYPPPRAATKY